MTSDSRSSQDQATFTTIYREHYPQILAYLRRRVAAAVAEEYCADVFGRAWANFSSLQDPQRPLPWLYGIAGNVVKEYYRGKSARQDRVEEEAELDQIAADDFSQVADLSLGYQPRIKRTVFCGSRHHRPACVGAVEHSGYRCQFRYHRK